MAQAKNGDKVKIDYTGKLEDGTVFDSTLEGECTRMNAIQTIAAMTAAMTNAAAEVTKAARWS